MGKSEQVQESKSRNRRAHELLHTGVEVREGSIRDDGPLDTEVIEVRIVMFSLTKNAALSKGLFVDGEWYVRVIDTATMDGRDRVRMLAVARMVANNA